MGTVATPCKAAKKQTKNKDEGAAEKKLGPEIEPPPLKKVKKEPASPAPAKTMHASQPTEAVESAGHNQASSSSAPSSSSASAAPVDSAVTQGELTSMFLPTCDYKPKASEPSAKETYMESDLVVPGIALKKMKQAMQTEGAIAQNYLAALAEDTMEMYKTKKPTLQKMVIADYVKYKDSFWKRVSEHFGDLKVRAIFAPKTAPLEHDTASRLTWNSTFQFDPHLTWNQQNEKVEMYHVDSRLKGFPPFHFVFGDHSL